jgi:hypothetical protein
MKFDRSLGTLTPGIPASAERATVEGTDHLFGLRDTVQVAQQPSR